MPTTDPRVDAYIEKSAEFARPVLAHLRRLVHAACPEVEETMKWSTPHFMYNGMLCAMSSFKQHCAFGFWKGRLVLDGAAGAEGSEGDAGEAGGGSAGQFGRITSLADLPPDDVLAGYVKRAMRLNDEPGAAPARVRKAPRPESPVPEDLAAALAENEAARATFERFSPSARREYVDWITEAKTDATRGKRLATTLEWLAEGRARNWKYEKC